jgi:hypothetical protein
MTRSTSVFLFLLAAVSGVSSVAEGIVGNSQKILYCTTEVKAVSAPGKIKHFSQTMYF